MKAVALGLIRLYQILLRPFLRSSCRFYPSCSDYARRAIEKRGVWIGVFLSLRRLLKCQPLHPGGFDPV